MSLAPSEQNELTAIEDRLSRSSPALAAMFAALSRQAGSQGPAGESLTPWRPVTRDAKRIVLLVVLAGLVIAAIAVTLVMARHGAPPYHANAVHSARAAALRKAGHFPAT